MPKFAEQTLDFAPGFSDAKFIHFAVNLSRLLNPRVAKVHGNAVRMSVWDQSSPWIYSVDERMGPKHITCIVRRETHPKNLIEPHEFNGAFRHHQLKLAAGGILGSGGRGKGTIAQRHMAEFVDAIRLQVRLRIKVAAGVSAVKRFEKEELKKKKETRVSARKARQICLWQTPIHNPAHPVVLQLAVGCAHVVRITLVRAFFGFRWRSLALHDETVNFCRQLQRGLQLLSK